MTISLRDNSRAIWIAGLVTLLASLQLIIVSNYVIIFLKDDLLVSIAIITVIISLRNLLQLFLRIPLGELSQIIGRRPLLLIGHFSYTLALISLFIAYDWILVLISIIFIAFGMSCFWPSLFAYIGDFSVNDNFGESNGRIFQMSDIGVLIGLFISTLLLNHLGMDLRDLFGVIILIGILSGFLGIFILPEGLAKEQRKSVPSIWKALIASFVLMLTSLKKITLTSKLFQVYGFQLVLAFIEFMTTSFIPVIIVSKGYTRGDVSEISLWAILIIIWFKPMFGRFTDRTNFVTTITFTLILSSIVVLLFPFINEFWLLVSLNLLLNGALITAYIATNNETSKRAPFELQGISLGTLGFYVAFGRTLSTIVLGPIWEIFGLTAVFLFTASIIFLLTMLLFRISNKKSKGE